MSARKALYAPYRELGLVCDGPCASIVHSQGTADFITTTINAGRTLHLYDISLRLILVSRPFPSYWPSSPISFLAAAHDLTFCALEHKIGVLKRFRPVGLWAGHEQGIRRLLVMGDVLLSACEQKVVVWRIPASEKGEVSTTGKMETEIALPNGFNVSAMAHPPTYINKVLLGSTDGSVILVNVRTGNLVHRFNGFGSYVTCLRPSPVLDVVAVGLEDGQIVLHNFRVDETVFAFHHTADKDGGSTHAVSCISFRTDGDESLVSADMAGNFYSWDLNTKMVRSHVRHVHNGGIRLTQYLQGEPLLVTAGADNTIKVHLFDEKDGEARVLRAREGHRLPPSLVRFCGYNGMSMVSTGLDRDLRIVSMWKEERNRAFAQKNVDKKGARSKKRKRKQAGVEKGDVRHDLIQKLPPVVSIASSDIRLRDEDFANIVTVHEGLEQVYTWRMQNGATHQHVLTPPEGPVKYQLSFRRSQTSNPAKKKKKSKPERKKRELKHATCAALSLCGNYALAGSHDGRIHSYNLQSGLHQGVYEDSSLPSNAVQKKKEEEEHSRPLWRRAHDSCVVGLAVDACGDHLISAGRSDKTIKFWNLHAREELGEPIRAPASIIRMQWCQSSDLLAVACSDFNIYVYDGATRNLARKFVGHLSPLADFSFDPKGRRIVSASADSTIRTWDLPSGRLIDTLACSDVPTSIAVAPGGEYIASTHVNSLGISLWVDSSKFRSLRFLEQNREDEDRITIVDTDEDEESQDNLAGQNAEDPEEGNSKAKLATSPPKETEQPQPLSENLATLSSKPLTHWTTLSNLQAIKDRNKPVEAPKKPANAPFFLPTVKGLSFGFDVKVDEGESKIKPSKRKKRKKAKKSQDGEEEDAWTNSQFGRLVAREQFNSAAQLLRRLDASGVDLELQTLEGALSRKNAARYFIEALSSPRDFELTQAHLGLFLQAHGMDLAKDPGGGAYLEQLAEAQNEGWTGLRETMSSVATLSIYFTTEL